MTRLSHRVPSEAFRSRPDEISERYQTEIDGSVARAERAWRKAQRRAERAEERYRKQPTVSRRELMVRVRAEAVRLRTEFEDLERLMKQVPVPAANRGNGQVRQRTGRDDHLELGVYKRPKQRKPPTEKGRRK